MNVLRSALPIVAGVLAGVGSSLLISKFRDTGTAPRVREHAIRVQDLSAVTPPSNPPHSNPDFSALQARLAELEARANAQRPAPQGPPPVPDRGGSQADHQDEHQETIDQHSRESIDPRWSLQANRLLEADLGEVASRDHLQLIRVDCRTTTCLATIAWQSYASALSTYGDLLHGAYRVNCGRRILLPPPEDRTRPYQAQLIFDCEGFRASER